jgi:hypothetical protein
MLKFRAHHKHRENRDCVQPTPGKIYSEQINKVNGVKLKVVIKFTYFGSTLSSSANIYGEVNTGISKASRTLTLTGEDYKH